MTVLRLLKSRWMLTLPLLLVLAAAVACGGEDATPPPAAATNTPSPTSTPQPTPTPPPTPTPVDFVALTQQIRGIVETGISSIDIPEGLTAEDVQSIVASAIANIPEGLSAEDVQAIVSQAISEIPEGLTVEQMEAAIRTAVDAGVQRAVSEAVAQIPPTATPDPDAMMMIDGEYGGTIALYNYAYASHFDLHVAPALDSTRGARAAFNGLVHYNYKDPREVICDLCTDWKLSDQGLTYTFNINPAATWQNGAPVTASDVKYSLDRMVEEGEPRPRAGAIKAYYESSRVVDPTTVDVTMSFPAGAFLKFLALDYMVMVNEAHTTSGLDVDLPENVLGSGAFRLVDVVVGEKWSFEKNDNYWKADLPYLNRVDILVVRGRSNQLAALLTGQALSSTGSPGGLDVPAQAAALEQAGGRLRPAQSMVGPIAAFVNHLNPPFDDVNVRKAINLAINRQEFRDGVYAGVMWPGSYFGPGVAHSEAEVSQWEGYRVNPDGSKVQEDLDAAKALLEASGYGPNKPLEFDIMVRTVSIYPTAAVFLEEQFEAIGDWVNVGIEEVESVAGIVRQATGEFQLSYRIIATLTDDPDGVFSPIYLPGGSENPLGYEDPRIVDLFERQKKELDPAKRVELLREADNILRQGESQWFQVGYGPSFGVASVKLQNQGLWPNQWGEFLRPTDMLAELEHIWFDPDAPLYDPNNPPYPAP